MKWLYILLASSALAQTQTPVTATDPPAKSPVVSSPQTLLREALEKQKASIARQRLSVRQQAETAGVRLTPWDIPAAECDPVEEALVTPLIESAAKAQKLQPELIRAVIEKESAFKPCAVSVKGAQGLMQLMPETAVQFGLHDAFDPKENIDAGAQFLKQLLDKYGDLAKALGAYNAGPGAVDQSGGIPDIPETKDYVESILKKLDPTRTAQPNTPSPSPLEIEAAELAGDVERFADCWTSWRSGQGPGGIQRPDLEQSDQSGGIPDIPETKDYVESILKKLDPTRTAQPSTPKPKPIGN